ncbi:MAG: YibE/F family protein [Clostridia bacterium]|nr:YibE/F family protein [Clostridia bacterium]
MKLKVKNKIQYVILIVGLILFFGLTYWLNQPMEGEVPTAASKVIFEKAHVKTILSEEASPDDWTEGLRLGLQEVIMTIDSGEFKGMDLLAYNYLSAYGNIDLKENTKVIVRMDTDESNNPYITSVSNYDRSFLILFLVGLFILLMIVFGGKKGFTALLGLGFTMYSIWFFLIPLIKRGFPVIPSAILLVSVTTFVSLVFLNGFSKKTMIAVLGCIGGVTIAGLIAYLAGKISPINGFNMSEAEELILRSGDQVKISGLLVSGVLISALGAVMDVAMMIASSISELKIMNPKAKRSQLFKSGLNIGQDAMGTMANTLILAFAGASLNMLLLFRIFDYPVLQIMNSDLMLLEIIQGISGSIGIVLTVPFVALLSASMFVKKKA